MNRYIILRSYGWYLDAKYLGIIKNQILKPWAARAAGGGGVSGFLFHYDPLLRS
jgi:hypothetical protein